MDDLSFWNRNSLGEDYWGDFQLSGDGSLLGIEGDDTDVQDAVIRIMSDSFSPDGFSLYPGVGANLSQFMGKNINKDLLSQIEKAAYNALTRDGRFNQSTDIIAVPVGEERIIRLLSSLPGMSAEMLPAVLDPTRGVDIPDRAESLPWTWRRGEALIQQVEGSWRGWIGSSIVWRLTHDALFTRSVVTKDMAEYGNFQSPLVAYGGAFLFCGYSASKAYAVKARATATGWEVQGGTRILSSLPDYPSVPDGVWCDQDTDNNIVIKISGKVAAIFDEGEQRWLFRKITTLS